MGSVELQASSGLATVAWHSIDWAACHRRVRSLQRWIVQAVQAIKLNCRVPSGAWVMLERSAGKLARCVLRGPGEREPT
jgi:RNA-directed DNA polymerase